MELERASEEDQTNCSFRCKQGRCKCCDTINHGATHFQSAYSKESFPIKFHLTCQSQFVIYLIECVCGQQYIGRTIQKLHLRLNKHRSNIKKGFIQHGVSRHIHNLHPGIENPIKITPIDHIPSEIPNRFERLKNKETFWIYKLQTLNPKGLNKITEVVVQIGIQEKVTITTNIHDQFYIHIYYIFRGSPLSVAYIHSTLYQDTIIIFRTFITYPENMYIWGSMPPIYILIHKSHKIFIL